MELALFGIATLLSFVSSVVLATLYGWPRLRAISHDQALVWLVAPHMFLRFIGLSFLIPGVVSPQLPAAFAVPAAYGDMVAGIMAIIAVIALANRASWAVPAVWVFNTWGAADLLLAIYQGPHLRLGPGTLGAAYYIPTAIVPRCSCPTVLSSGCSWGGNGAEGAAGAYGACGGAGVHDAERQARDRGVRPGQKSSGAGVSRGVDYTRGIPRGRPDHAAKGGLMSAPAHRTRILSALPLALITLAAALPAASDPAMASGCDLIFPPATIRPLPAKPNRVTVADLNHDGKPDLIVSTPDDSSAGYTTQISVMLGKGGGVFTAPQNYRVGSRPLQAVAGDFDGDGILDLAVTNWASNNVAILHGHGNGTFGGTTRYFPCGTEPHGLVAADFNHDGILDLAVANNGVPSVSVLMGLGSGGVGDGTFAAPVAYPLAGLSLGISTADLDGDGNLDLVASANFAGIAVLMGHDDGTFADAHSYPAGAQPTQITIHDLDADGIPDLLVCNSSFGGVAFLKGLGGGVFSSPTMYGAGTINANSTVIADFNGDGIADFALSDPQHGYSYENGLLHIFVGHSTGGLPDGTFSLQSTYTVSSYCLSIATADLNGDGMPDVAVAGYGTKVVDILFGDCPPVAGVDDPAAPLSLVLGGARPNPASGRALRVDFTLPSSEPARLELFDVAGRRMLAREVGSLGPGPHTVDLATGRRIPAGFYVIRFSGRGAVRTARVAVLN